MNKITLALKSRTFWTIFLTVIINTVNANQEFIPANAVDTINVVLGLLATYFHVNPAQNYNK